MDVFNINNCIFFNDRLAYLARLSDFRLKFVVKLNLRRDHSIQRPFFLNKAHLFLWTLKIHWTLFPWIAAFFKSGLRKMQWFHLWANAIVALCTFIFMSRAECAAKSVHHIENILLNFAFLIVCWNSRVLSVNTHYISLVFALWWKRFLWIFFLVNNLNIAIVCLDYQFTLVKLSRSQNFQAVIDLFFA